MTSWWSCPRCGVRLRWTRTTVSCPRTRACGYTANLPVPQTAAEGER